MDKTMNLQKIIDELDLTILTEPRDFANITPTGGYSSDLLSCVMAGAGKGYLWITLQAHLNIVAIAALNEVAAIIITENAQPDAASIAKANEQGVILLSTSRPTYEVNGKLWEIGIRN
jgi:DRTGG domain